MLLGNVRTEMVIISIIAYMLNFVNSASVFCGFCKYILGTKPRRKRSNKAFLRVVWYNRVRKYNMEKNLVKTQFAFSLEGKESKREAGISAVKWFMGNEDLYDPECMIIYQDGYTFRSFRAKDFRPDRISRVKLEDALLFTIVAGLTEEDVDRVSVAYSIEVPSIVINFPNVETVTPEGMHLLERFRKEVGLPEMEIR